MKERPILFSGPMVCAILEGRKTQTRRVVKPQPPSVEAVHAKAGIDYGWIASRAGDVHRPSGPVWAVRNLMGCEPELRCPFGKPGDRLWVRETWCHEWDQERERWSDPPRALYRADGRDVVHVDDIARSPWTPSIHMPRWASRITLEIIGVCVERVQEISDADALAEGVPDCNDDSQIPPGFSRAAMNWRPAHEFQDLWDSINGKRPGCSWDANPWVWVVEFKRVSP